MTPPADIFKKYETYSNDHALDELMELIADDAVYLFSNESCHIGRAAIRAAIAHNFYAIEDGTYAIRKLRWLVESADTASCVYEYHWTGKIDGSSLSGHGRGTNVLKRAGNRWLVIHEHLSRGKID